MKNIILKIVFNKICNSDCITYIYVFQISKYLIKIVAFSHKQNETATTQVF